MLHTVLGYPGGSCCVFWVTRMLLCILYVANRHSKITGERLASAFQTRAKRGKIFRHKKTRASTIASPGKFSSNLYEYFVPAVLYVLVQTADGMIVQLAPDYIRQRCNGLGRDLDLVQNIRAVMVIIPCRQLVGLKLISITQSIPGLARAVAFTNPVIELGHGPIDHVILGKAKGPPQRNG